MTIAELPPAWREAEQERLLRRHLALACPQGTRRRTDPQPDSPSMPHTLAERRVWVRRMRLAHATTPEIARRVGASIATITRDLAWLRQQARSAHDHAAAAGQVRA